MAEMTPLVLEIKANTSSATASIKKLKSEMSGIGKSFGGVSSMAKSHSSAMKGASKSTASFAKTLASAPFKKLTKDISGTVGAVTKLTSGFKRVLFYRAIRTMIKEIGAAIKSGVNNLYAWSNALGGEFAASMDRISTAFNYFKNSIGAAVAPLINALAPAIDFVIDKAVALLNVINQLFARLTGQSYWTRATKAASSYGDAVSGAGSAAKEALRYLAPFDELNVLPSDSGSGGGGGGGASGGGGLFEIQEDFSEAVSNFADMVKEAWNTGDWEEVGTFLGNKVNDLINNLPWATMGANVGKFINALFGTEYWTLETINFVNLGNKIAEFVNNALENIDFDIAGRLQVRKLTAILDTIIGFIEGLDWGLVASSISDFIVGAINEFSEWLSGTDWATFTTKLHNGIINAINGVKAEDISNAITNLLTSLTDATIEITVAFAKNTWIDLKNEWNLRMLEFENDAVQVVVSFALDETIWPLKIHDWVSEHIRNPILEEVADAFGVDTSSAGYALGESLVNNFGLAISKTFPVIGSVVNIAELVGNLFGGGTWEEIKQKFKGEWNGFWDDIAAWLNGGDAPDWTRSIASIIAEKLNLGEVFTNAWKDLKESLVEGWKNFINDPTISKILDFFSNPIGTLMDLVEGLGSGSSTSETDTGTIGVGVGTGIGANTFNIPVTAEISDFKLSDKFRRPDIDSNADMTSSTDGLTDADKSFDSTANWRFQTTAPQWAGTSWKSTAVWRWQNTAPQWAGTSWNSTANWRYQSTSPMWAGTSWNSTANWRYQTTASQWAGTSWNSTANWRWQSTAPQWGGTTWTSTANWRYQSVDPYWGGTTWNSTANFKYADDNIPSWEKEIDWCTAKVRSISDAISDKTLYGFTAQIYNTKNASGGVYVNNHWNNITRYASGGLPKGSQLFWAREAGPELVGTLGGHTAVMNNDQIVASVSAGVARAISNVEFHMNGAFAAPVYTDETNEMDEETMYRAFKRALDETDFGGDVELDGETLFRSMVKMNRKNTRATGVNAFA